MWIKIKKLNTKTNKQKKNWKIIGVHAENTDLISKMIKRKNYLVSESL
jgi:hypothetical protein